MTLKKNLLGIGLLLVSFRTMADPSQVFHLKESVPTAYMTNEDGLRLAESKLFKSAFDICGETIAIRMTALRATRPGPFSVALEADFQCGL